MAVREGAATPAPASLPLTERLHISSLDLRLAIMAAVLAAMAVGFHIVTGNFLTPENLYNVAQQSAVVGIVAAAIGLVIVERQIDLSVGSVLATVGVLVAWLIYSMGWHWVPACLAGWAVALAIALYQGWLTAYLGVPSFVVTLGGLVTFRGAAFLITDGRTQPVTDASFLLIGGGLDGAIGVTASWALGIGLCAWLAWRTLQRRRLTVSHGFTPRPLLLDVLYTGFFAAALLAFVAAMCAYRIPSKDAPQGIPNPVLIWAAVVAFVAFIVNRTAFGRYIYAIGGNEEAAQLSGIDTGRVKVVTYAISGLLAGIAAVLYVAQYRQGKPDAGAGLELDAIAAVVIGGTSLMGGRGSMAGTFCGVLIFGLLSNILQLHNINSNLQLVLKGLIIVGTVLVQERNLADLMSFVRMPANRGAQKETAGPAPPDRTSRNPGGNST